MIFKTKCVECGRVFDLLDEEDANEWAYGHDCEDIVGEIMKECVYCSTDLLKGINWWFDYEICNDCHNEKKDTDEDYKKIITTEILRKIIFGEDN